MRSKFYTLLTEIGAAKLASAAALGVPLKITHMAVGDGGGVLPTPSAQQTALVAEKRRAALNMLYIDPQNSSQIIAEQVIPETEGGWWIREVGLFDETGALIAVGNCPESYKPQLTEGSGRTQTVRMVLITSSTDNITLKIDPAVVLATRKYVDDKALELKVYVDDLMAKHLAAPDPHSQYAQKDSPTLTGIPKVPTPAAGNSTKQIANTEFVASSIAAMVDSAPAALDTLNELAAALGNDPNFATTMINALAGKQPLDNTLTNLSGKDIAGLLTYLGLGETANLAAGALQKDQNGADIPDTALFRQSIGVYDASTSQKGLVRLNGGVTDESNETAATSGAVKVAYDAAIAAADIAKTKWSAVDATISQKGIVMLSDNTGVPDSTTAATTTAVNYVLNQAAAAYSLAESKYTAGGATTGKAGLVQLVNSMGGSGSLVMPQAAVTTAIQNYPSLGKGQTLQDLRGTRSIDATYTNSTGFPIAVYVRIAGGTSANLYVHVNGIEFGGGGSIASNTSIATAFFIVPNGATYRVMASGSSIALQAWSELR